MPSPSLTWSSPVSTVPGIGPKRDKALKQSGIATVGQMLEWFPRRYVDHSAITHIKNLQQGQTATVTGTVLKTTRTKGRKPRFFVLVSDDTGFLTCTWFAGVQYIAKRFKPGNVVAFTGRVGFYNGLQMVHPDFEFTDTNSSFRIPVWPIYPTPESWSRAGFDSRQFRKWIYSALPKTRFKESVLPQAIAEQNRVPSLKKLFSHIHFPESLESGKRALNQFRFCELFVLAYSLLRRKKKSNEGGRVLRSSFRLKQVLLSSLPFCLTAAQTKVLQEIEQDTLSEKRMNRLIQGDVGSGKTIVALLSATHYLEHGCQVAFMAPTEILSRQHYQTFCSLLEPLGITIELVTGSRTTADRGRISNGLKNGKIQLAVGTHALLSESTRFQHLGLTVVDEQHRFGVEQRLSLFQKGARPDTLVMSATPIPRTVALVLYGDLDISVIDEKPSGRKEITTRIVPETKRSGMYAFVREAAKQGQRAYVILPLVDESSRLEDIGSATETAKKFRQHIFRGMEIGLLHGRLNAAEKHRAIDQFRNGETPILVSTTVVEVGMDIREANIMVVEHAERFGLSQLHQLRGRIGRGEQEAYCFLLPSTDASDQAKDRLTQFCSTNDGFQIAEMDLEMRGPGNIVGLQQSGFSVGRQFNPFFNPKIFLHARSQAEKVITQEYDVTDPEIQRLNTAADRLLAQLRGQGSSA